LLYQAFARGWTLISMLETRKEHNHQVRRTSVAQIAQRLNKDPLDTMLDLALDENLETEFGFLHVVVDEDDTIELCRHPYTHISNSDGGAHVRFLTISTWPVHFLSRLVPARQAMALEQAVGLLHDVVRADQDFDTWHEALAAINAQPVHTNPTRTSAF
jgi:N-acyl-D-aspartate/D-glutamate deacylase